MIELTKLFQMAEKTMGEFSTNTTATRDDIDFVYIEGDDEVAPMPPFANVVRKKELSEPEHEGE